MSEGGASAAGVSHPAWRVVVNIFFSIHRTRMVGGESQKICY